MASGTIKKKSGGGGAYDFISSGAEFISTFTKTINLKNDTTFDSWEPTTTNTMIRQQSSNNDFSLSNCNTLDYDYCLVTFFDVDVAHLPGATLKKTPIKIVHSVTFLWFSYPSGTYIVPGTPSTGTGSTTTTCYIKYYNSSGNIEYGTSSYGPMRISGAPTLSVSPGSANTTFGIKVPTIFARCNTTYFDTSRKAEVDSANTNGVFTIEVYRMPKKKWSISYTVYKSRDIFLS